MNIAVFLKIAELTKYFEKVCFWKSLFFLKIASSKCFLRRPATWTRRKYGSSRMLKNEYVEHNVILEGVFMLMLILLFTYRKSSNWMKLLVEVRRGVMLMFIRKGSNWIKLVVFRWVFQYWTMNNSNSRFAVLLILPR